MNTEPLQSFMAKLAEHHFSKIAASETRSLISLLAINESNHFTRQTQTVVTDFIILNAVLRNSAGHFYFQK